MKKHYLATLTFAAMAMTAVHANTAALAKTEAKAATLSVEEQAFAAKLAETTRQAFSLMSAQLRQEALSHMKNPALTADAAVEQVMKDHPTSSIKVEVNTK